MVASLRARNSASAENMETDISESRSFRKVDSGVGSSRFDCVLRLLQCKIPGEWGSDPDQVGGYQIGIDAADPSVEPVTPSKGV